MTTPDGEWVDVGGRMDWVPSTQPASPDGQPGRWHVVTDAAGSRWEWHPKPPPPPPPTPPWGPQTPGPSSRPYTEAGTDRRSRLGRVRWGFNGVLVLLLIAGAGTPTVIALAAVGNSVLLILRVVRTGSPRSEPIRNPRAAVLHEAVVGCVWLVGGFVWWLIARADRRDQQVEYILGRDEPPADTADLWVAVGGLAMLIGAIYLVAAGVAFARLLDHQSRRA